MRLPLFVGLCLHCVFHFAIAQNESGVRALNDTAYKQAGYWFDSTNSMFQESFPIIRSIPPLNTGMPAIILLSYIGTDSLLRFTTQTQLDSMILATGTLNDTIRNAAKYMYLMNNYDPVLFNQYAGEVAINNVSLSGGRYKSSLYNLKTNVSAFIAGSVVDSLRHRLFSMLFADYIIRVRILDVDSIVDKRRITSVEPSTTKRYTVCATILDKIKGQVIPAGSCISEETIISTISSQPTVSFQYLRSMYWNHNPDANGFRIQNDTALTDANGRLQLEVGQECVVFLNLQNQLYDYENDYFDLDVQPICSNGILPIDGGNVRDINQFWSATVSQPYSAWRNSVISLVAQIMSLSY